MNDVNVLSGLTEWRFLLLTSPRHRIYVPSAEGLSWGRRSGISIERQEFGP